MNSLSNYDLVNIWDNLHHEDKIYNTCLIASIILKEGNANDYYNYSIERLDGIALQSRIQTFGPSFHNFSKCPACKESLEWTFDFESLNLPDFASRQEEEFSFKYYESIIKIRLPNSQDVALLDLEKIVTNCIISIDNQTQNLKSVPIDLIEVIQREMESVAPYSNISFNLSCPSCKQIWNAPFSIVDYYIEEISINAKKIMFQVHTICSNYSWSEKEVLLMSNKKRKFYLDLIN